jgi:hypothetical protein
MDTGGMTNAGRPWGWRSYQRVRGVEAIVVAKQKIWRCSGCASIAHRSCACGRQDSAEEGHVDLERMVTGKYVKEVCKDDREVLPQSRG